MNYNFFESIEYTIFGYLVFPLLIIIITILLFVLKNKIARALLAILLLFFVIEASSFTFSVASKITSNEDKEIKYIKISANLALIPYERGTRYAETAAIYADKKDKVNAKKYYELAYKHIKDYNDEVFLTAGITYLYLLKDYDKAITIFSRQERFAMLSECYILQNDWKNALVFAQKYVKKYPKNSYGYELLTLIYKNLADNTNANLNYKQAQKLCSYTVCNDRLKSMTKNYKTYFQDRFKTRN